MPTPDETPLTPVGQDHEERLEKLERWVKLIAEHQTNLGATLITSLTQISNMKRDLVDSGVAEEAEEARAPNRAALIHPGGHPLRGKPS